MLTILDANQLVYKAFISQLSEKWCNHVDPPVQNYQGIKLVRGDRGVVVCREKGGLLV